MFLFDDKLIILMFAILFYVLCSMLLSYVCFGDLLQIYGLVDLGVNDFVVLRQYHFFF